MRGRCGALLCLLVLLCGCASGAAEYVGDPGNAAYEIYFAVQTDEPSGAALRGETHAVSRGEGAVEALMAHLLAGPDAPDLRRIVPEGVTLQAWSRQGNTVNLDLSEEYGGLSGVELTLADYSIALTLCQIDGVRAVRITADGETLPTRSTQMLRATDALLSLYQEGLSVRTVTLYFPRRDGAGFGEELWNIAREEDESLASAVAEALRAGPESEELLPVFPTSGALRSVEMRDGICWLDLSAAFAQAEENLPALCALINTLSGLSGVSGIQLLTDGESAGWCAGMPAAELLELARGLMDTKN